MGGREDRTRVMRGSVRQIDRRRGRQRCRSSVRGDDVGVRGDASAPGGGGRRRVRRRREGPVVGSIPGGDGVRVRCHGKRFGGGVCGRVGGGVGRRGGGGGDADTFVRRVDGGARVGRASARRRRRGCDHPRVARADPRAAEIEARRKEQRDTLACLRAEISDEGEGETRATDPDSDLAKRSSDGGSGHVIRPVSPAWDLPAWADVAKPKPSATNGDDADAPKSSPSRAAAGAWSTRAAGYEIHGVGRGVRSSGDGARRHLGAVDAADISVELVPKPSRFDGTAANVDEDDAALYYADSEPGGEATDAFGALTVSASGLAPALAKVDEEGSGKDAARAETPEPSVIPEPSASPVVSRRADGDDDADDDLATAPRALRFEDDDNPRERASKIARVSDVSLTFAAESPGAAAERASFERRRSLRRSALFSPRASPSSSPSPPKSPPSPSAAARRFTRRSRRRSAKTTREKKRQRSP